MSCGPVAPTHLKTAAGRSRSHVSCDARSRRGRTEGFHPFTKTIWLVNGSTKFGVYLLSRRARCGLAGRPSEQPANDCGAPLGTEYALHRGKIMPVGTEIVVRDAPSSAYRLRPLAV